MEHTGREHMMAVMGTSDRGEERSPLVGTGALVEEGTWVEAVSTYVTKGRQELANT